MEYVWIIGTFSKLNLMPYTCRCCVPDAIQYALLQAFARLGWISSLDITLTDSIQT